MSVILQLFVLPGQQLILLILLRLTRFWPLRTVSHKLSHTLFNHGDPSRGLVDGRQWAHVMYFPNHCLGCGLVGSVVPYPEMQSPQTLSHHPSCSQPPWQRHHFAPSDQRWQRESLSVAQSCPTLCDPMDCSLPGSSVRGILQARILEWVAMPSFSRFSWPRDPAQVWATSEALEMAKASGYQSSSGFFSCWCL